MYVITVENKSPRMGALARMNTPRLLNREHMKKLTPENVKPKGTNIRKREHVVEN
jgi:hypothetical protein